MNDVREMLSIKIESPYWEEAYQLALAEPPVPEWLTEEYVRTLHDECGVIPQSLEAIVSAIPYVVEVPELCLLAKTLYHILATKKKGRAAFPVFELPKAPEFVENTIGYDCFAIFPILAHLRPSWKELEDRGVEKSVLTDSLRWADLLFTWATERVGRPAFEEPDFLTYGVAIYVNYLTIGRLRFEIYQNSNRPARIFKNSNGEFCALMDNTILHRSGHILDSYSCTDESGSYPADFLETEDAYEGYAVDDVTRLVQNFRTTLSKKEWKPAFLPGDDAIKVHIPYGGKLDKAACEESYQRAHEIYGRCFPEIKFKGFLLCCWMLSPELKSILSPESNIIAFQDKYYIFPAKSSAEDAFLYAFGISGKKVDEISIPDLPETNSLMRGIKAKALEGTYIHEFNGFIPW